MSLFQKYRPADFDSLYGQEFVREVLQNALKLDRTVGAYLFHGSRGTGKTSVARIMAKGMNCLSLRENGNPCDQCENCTAFNEGRLLDIIEIDAASNTWVDNIRDMIERAQFQPTQARYKVYIIDEVHMLSKGAFNALLKTLEEPPKHVKFILATTEIQKIPDTIISRTQRYDFKRIKSSDIIGRLKYISEKEGIDAEESALALIAHLAKWGLRDAITLFEQYAVGGVLKRKYIEDNLEIIGEDFLVGFVGGLVLSDAPKTLGDLDILREKGIDVRLFLEQTLSYLRDQMAKHLASKEFSFYSRLFDAFEGAYGKLKFVPDSFILLETTVFRLLANVAISSQEVAPVPQIKAVLPKQAKEAAPKEVVQSASTEPTRPLQKEEEIVPVSAWEGVARTENTKPFNFSEFVEYIRTVPKRSFVGLSLKASAYDFSDGMLTIFCDNDFNFNKLDAADVKSFLAETMDKLFGPGYRLQIQKWRGGKKAAKSLADEAGDIF